jgi:hypothetical protein
MKKQGMFWTWAMMIGLFLGITLMTGQAIAADPTMGDVISQLATTLGMNAPDLTAMLLTPNGLNANSPANENNLGTLYAALNAAITNGSIKPPAGQTATTLLTNAANAANVPAQTTQNAMTYGSSLTATRVVGGGAPVSFSVSAPGGGSGGGGAVSPSK